MGKCTAGSNLFKLDQTIQVGVCGCLLVQTGSNLLQLDQIGSNHIKLDQIRSKRINVAQNESNWFKIDKNTYFKLDQIGLKWIKLF